MQALREKKKTQEASLAAVSKQTEALHVKIADIQKSIADGAKLAEALQEELDGLTAQKEQATAEQQALNGDIKTLKWETEEIQEREAAFRQKYEELLEEKSKLDLDLNTCRANINQTNLDIARLQTQIKQEQEQLDEKEEERAFAQSRLEKTQQEFERLNSKIDALRGELVTVNNQIAAAGTEESELRAKLAVQKDELNAVIGSKSEAVRQLSGEIESLKTQLANVTEVSDTLACEKTEAAKRHADKQAQLTALQQEIRHLHAETEALQQEKLDCAKNKEQMENKLTELNKDIRLYQEFFDSDECKRTQLEIDRLGRIAHLYQDGVKQLFNGMTPPAEHLGNLRQYYYEMRSKLSAQLAAVRGGLDTLSTGYLDLIARIEKEVNG